MFSLKLLRTKNFLPNLKVGSLFAMNIPKYNFARKVKASSSVSPNSNKKNQNEENQSDLEDAKTINVVREDVPIKISPYFSKAVSDKEKSATSINISQLVEVSGKKQKADAMTLEEKQEVIKTKQKLTAAKKQSSKTIGVVIENIKRELPKEL
jgi:polynucleotide 5'-kinase involved in rRNA processing